jgi:hypothetical protein
VFLSYANDDRDLADRISVVLARSGIDTTNQAWDVPAAESPEGRLREGIRASDIVVLLLTPAAAADRWAGEGSEYALPRDLDLRGADLIPVLAVPTDLPSAFRERAVVDLTQDIDGGLQKLADQILAVSRADFSAMTPPEFESFVADLLRAMGFRVDEAPPVGDMGVDMRATYVSADPFGSPQTEVWLVQVKLYSHHRVSVSVIRELVGALAGGSGGTRGLLVTNAQLTSVALDFAAEMERRSPARLRVLDGVELRRLLRQFPSVAARHFGEVARPDPVADGDS